VALKEDLKYIKDEISTEEQFFEGFLKLERFFKKYKNILISVVAAAVIGGVGYKGYDHFNEKKLSEASEAYFKLLENPNDEGSLSTLKEKNQKLYEVFLLNQALEKGDISKLNEINIQNKVLKDLLEYSKATISGDINNIRQYANGNEAIMKDFAILQEGYILLKEGKIKEGDELLSKIDFQSPLRNTATFLKHYTIKGQK